MKKTSLIAGVFVGTVTVVIAVVQTGYDGWNSNGTNTVFDGYHAIAFGEQNEAYQESLTGGFDNTATQRSLAMGISNYSSDSSIAVGMGNYADDQALAVGDANTVANGGGAIGSYNTVTADGSVALGFMNESRMDDGDGYGNILIGRYNIAGPDAVAYAEENVLIGDSNYSTSNRAWTFGKGNIGQVETLTVGTYAEMVSNASFIVGTGHGTGAGERENGLIVMKNGDVVIPKAQGDVSMGIYQ